MIGLSGQRRPAAVSQDGLPAILRPNPVAIERSTNETSVPYVGGIIFHRPLKASNGGIGMSLASRLKAPAVRHEPTIPA